MTVIAVDVDLRKVYAWCSKCGEVCKAAPDAEAVIAHERKHGDSMMLCEIAGPVDYTDNKAVAHNKRRWTIYNVATIADIASRMFHTVPLVSPSSDWTSSYSLEVRHKLAKATAKQKDLRECEAMIWSYQMKPSAWLPLPSYLARL